MVLRGSQRKQRRGDFGHCMTRLGTSLTLALHLSLALGASLSFNNQIITSNPISYACGFYTMSYRLWCDPTAVTSYVAALSDCALAAPEAVQNGGSSLLLNNSNTVFSSGLVAALACPPAPAFAVSMSCLHRTDCTVNWPGHNDNTQAICLVLISTRSFSTTCDISVEGPLHGRWDPHSMCMCIISCTGGTLIGAATRTHGVSITALGVSKGGIRWGMVPGFRRMTRGP